MDTSHQQYTDRLVTLQSQGFKRHLWFLNPYLWHIRSIIQGPTLEVGCGIGRVLNFAPQQIIGVDHNPASISVCRARGLQAYTGEEFHKQFKSPESLRFQTLLMSHLLEHLTLDQSAGLLNEYKPYLTPKAKIIAITPQERGYASDATHVQFMDYAALESLFLKVGISVGKTYSFPFPRGMGASFIYNEFVIHGEWP